MASLTIEACSGRTGPGRVIRRLGRSMSALIDERLQPFGLTYMRWVALKMVADGARTAGELAREVGLTTGAMTRMIDELESQGLLSRARCGGDRRVVRLALTDAGEDAVVGALPHIHSLWNSLLESFDQAQLQSLLEGMERLATALDARLNDGPQPVGRLGRNAKETVP